MLKIFKEKYFLFKAVKTNTTKYYNIFSKSFRKNKKRLLLLMPGNTGDKKFSVCKFKMPTEYREKGIRCFKN